MVQRMSIRGMEAWVAQAGQEALAGDRVCYLLMPGGLKDDVAAFIEQASEEHSCTMVVLSGMNWNDDLTPWPAEGVFKEKKPFGGKAREFAIKLEACCTEIEAQLGISDPSRYLLGISLSGLFAVWVTTCSDSFIGICSISGSLWYDGFSQWFCNQNVRPAIRKIYISLGLREKNSKDRRIATVEDATGKVVDHLKAQGLETMYNLEDCTHFSPIIPRLQDALDALLNE